MNGAPSEQRSNKGGSAAETVSVVVRVRPLGKDGIPLDNNGASFSASVLPPDQGLKGSVVSVVDSRVLIFDPVDRSGLKQPKYHHGSRRNKEVRYAFDKVFRESATQQEVYEKTTQPLIDSVLNGFNATVLAYGATGAGKTHTVTGTSSQPGIIFRAMKDLYQRIIDEKANKVIEASLSYLEVYNETIRDLLTQSENLDLREDETHVEAVGLSEHTPESVDSVMKLLLLGNNNRTKASTEANATSSRSHAVLQIHIKQRERGVNVSSRYTNATLTIIDLAGSERASVTSNKGKLLHEGANINRSLLALGNCINALCIGRTNHIPYRDSKLTRLLKHSFGGNCKVVMIANVSPAPQHYEETRNTLQYANRAKNIETKVEQNAINLDYHISQYPMIIAELRAQVDDLKGQLETYRLQETSTGAPLSKPTIRTPIKPAPIGHHQPLESDLRRIRSLYSKLADLTRQNVTARVTMENHESWSQLISVIKDELPNNDDSTGYWNTFGDLMANGRETLTEIGTNLTAYSDEIANRMEQLATKIEQTASTIRHDNDVDETLKDRLNLEIQVLESGLKNVELSQRLQLQASIQTRQQKSLWNMAKQSVRNIKSMTKNDETVAFLEASGLVNVTNESQDTLAELVMSYEDMDDVDIFALMADISDDEDSVGVEGQNSAAQEVIKTSKIPTPVRGNSPSPVKTSAALLVEQNQKNVVVVDSNMASDDMIVDSVDTVDLINTIPPDSLALASVAKTSPPPPAHNDSALSAVTPMHKKRHRDMDNDTIDLDATPMAKKPKQGGALVPKVQPQLMYSLAAPVERTLADLPPFEEDPATPRPSSPIVQSETARKTKRGRSHRKSLIPLPASVRRATMSRSLSPDDERSGTDDSQSSISSVDDVIAVHDDHEDTTAAKGKRSRSGHSKANSPIGVPIDLIGTTEIDSPITTPPKKGRGRGRKSKSKKNSAVDSDEVTVEDINTEVSGKKARNKKARVTAPTTPVESAEDAAGDGGERRITRASARASKA
ncbi:hypothetical protein SmJEL517_g00681 [Synchytrium microbalum]|uniref:Kinesin motor domain-containing protein n=1 Tax=Synchytrium microbalum TaxID=1806994 RepID=A0A507CE24_9FUNG|nr:uncharacterized protein SmJEL517_g00681 [Synchytrium microbalum]TPX37429.1 hypothetical protein SmJEL517_g00681 [Synchytrium microbalum]